MTAADKMPPLPPADEREQFGGSGYPAEVWPRHPAYWIEATVAAYGQQCFAAGRAAAEAEAVKLRATLGRISDYAADTIRTHSKDRDDWAADMVMVGRMAKSAKGAP